MNTSIAFLHTAPANVTTFERLLQKHAPDLQVVHILDESLLNDARAQGPNAALADRVHQRMDEAAAGAASVVVCTCSSIGGMAEDNPSAAYRSMRIDRAMADQAVAAGDRILVVAALESTVAPTLALIQSSAQRVGRSPHIDVLVVDGSWDHFVAGNQEAYERAIAHAIQQKSIGADVIVLAQATMAGAAERCEGIGVPILSSPEIGILQALAEMGK
jgi:hypothetical protein